VISSDRYGGWAVWSVRPWASSPSSLSGISISSAVFAGLTTVTDRRTDHATWSVAIGHM